MVTSENKKARHRKVLIYKKQNMKIILIPKLHAVGKYMPTENLKVIVREDDVQILQLGK